jgi:hypothetical protein
LKIAVLYAEYIKAGCIGKYNTNNLPAPTDLTKNPYGIKDATQKTAPLVSCGIKIESEPTEPIFEKCPHLREKGGVLFKIGLIRNRLSRTATGSSELDRLSMEMPAGHQDAKTRGRYLL